MIAFGLAFSVGAITLFEGVKRLPAAETSLLSVLEVVFAPVLAWVFFNEIPAIASFVGGGLILAAVIGTQVLAAPEKISVLE